MKRTEARESNTGDGFKNVTARYKADPSIENYVRLRRAHPNAEIEVAVLGGLDHLFYLEPTLRRWGIEADLFAAVLDADADAISALALLLMEKMIEAKKLAKNRETSLVRRGLAIPDQLVDWLICVSLDGLSWNNQLTIPRDLIVLIRERLGGSTRAIEDAYRAHELKKHAVMLAGQLTGNRGTPSLRKIAKLMGTTASTLSRAFAPGEFEKRTEYWARQFGEGGMIRKVLDAEEGKKT